MKRQISLALVLLLCLLVRPAAAQTVGGGCATSGQTTFTTYGLLVCNGSNWKLAEDWYGSANYGYTLQNFGNDGGSCTSAKTGELIYTGSTWQYCDGSTWQAFPPSSTATAVSQSGVDGCAVVNGKLYCWGQNVSGETGQGVAGYPYLNFSPRQVGTDTTWTAVSTGGTDTCGLDNGKLYCWGYNNEGQDGIGNQTQNATPQQVGADTTWTAVSTADDNSTGAVNTCGIDSGKLYCWGTNYYGQVGINSGTYFFSSPQQVGSDTTWTEISTGGTDVCGIDNGKLYCWGYNAHGELGLGNTTTFKTPQQVGADTTWTAISQGNYDTCGIDNGKLYCWGYNAYGNDGQNNTTQYTTPQQVGADTTWTAISQGGVDACGIDNGKLYCWGWNGQGEDGLGNTTQHNLPQQVGSDTTWTAISAEQHNGTTGVSTCGIDNGKAYCTGYNSSGQLGLGTSQQSNSFLLTIPLY